VGVEELELAAWCVDEEALDSCGEGDEGVGWAAPAEPFEGEVFEQHLLFNFLFLVLMTGEVCVWETGFRYRG
jgi:hypothetical protein